MRSLKKTILLKIDPRRPDKKSILQSAKIIRSGGLVAFPTETVYGLAADFLNSKAINRLYEAKNRPRRKPLAVHIADLKMIKKMGCRITKDAKALISKFWPGPLTIVLRSKGGKKTGFRMPANEIAYELIKASKVPIAAPSANLSGKPPPTSAKDVLEQLDGRIDLILDGGRTALGVESTVVDLTISPPKVLREGAIKSKTLFKYIRIRGQ